MRTERQYAVFFSLKYLTIVEHRIYFLYAQIRNPTFCQTPPDRTHPIVYIAIEPGGIGLIKDLSIRKDDHLYESQHRQKE